METEVKMTARFNNKVLIEFFGILKDESTLLNCVQLGDKLLVSSFGLAEVLDLSLNETSLDEFVFKNKVEFRINGAKTYPTSLFVSSEARKIYKKIEKNVISFEETFLPGKHTETGFCSFLVFTQPFKTVNMGKISENMPISITNSNLAFLDYDNFSSLNSFGVCL